MIQGGGLFDVSCDRRTECFASANNFPFPSSFIFSVANSPTFGDDALHHADKAIYLRLTSVLRHLRGEDVFLLWPSHSKRSF